jgi:transposase InsO family protein
MAAEGEQHWIVRIDDHRVRKSVPEEGSSTSYLEFNYRCHWVGDDGRSTGTSWEPEETFVSEVDNADGMLATYISKHRVGMGTKLSEAVRNNPDLMFCMQYHRDVFEPPQKAHEATTETDSDSEEYSAEEDEGYTKPPRIRVPQYDVQCQVGAKTMTIQFDKTGFSVWSCEQCANAAGLVHNDHLMMSAGMYMASVEEGCFWISTDVLSTMVSFVLTGDSDGVTAEVMPGPVSVVASPVPAGEELAFDSALHAAAFMYLSEGEVTGEYNRTSQIRKDFKTNIRRRFQIRDGELHYNKNSRTRKTFHRQLDVAMNPTARIPRMGEMWQLVVADHLGHHDGWNAAESRMRDTYMHAHLRAMIRHVRRGCTVCDGFNPVKKGIVRGIVTRRPMELIMFDLFTLPCSDRNGWNTCITMIDHFTKYKWAKAFASKRADEVVAFLESVHRHEGTAERWHSDNGGEFIATIMKELARRLKTKHSFGRARHPQTQGLVERENGALKRVILKMGMALGHTDPHSEFDWTDTLEEATRQRNDANVAIYGKLTPWFCLRNRPRCLTTCHQPGPELLSKLHAHMFACQQKAANRMAPLTDEVQFYPGDAVSIHKTAYDTKMAKAYHPWATKAIIVTESSTHPGFYTVRYVAAAHGRKRTDEIDKRLMPWTKLQLVKRGPGPMKHTARAEAAAAGGSNSMDDFEWPEYNNGSEDEEGEGQQFVEDTDTVATRSVDEHEQEEPSARDEVGKDDCRKKGTTSAHISCIDSPPDRRKHKQSYVYILIYDNIHQNRHLCTSSYIITVTYNHHLCTWSYITTAMHMHHLCTSSYIIAVTYNLHLCTSSYIIAVTNNQHLCTSSYIVAVTYNQHLCTTSYIIAVTYNQRLCTSPTKAMHIQQLYILIYYSSHAVITRVHAF